jgi:hypothetical protein
MTATAPVGDAEVDRVVRRIREHVRQAPPPRPVPYERSALFREPAYRDGQPYADDDDLEDDGD